MTSNIGSEHILEGNSQLVEQELRNYLRPELMNRIDEIIVFNALEKEQINKILDKIILEIEERLKHLNIHIKLTDRARGELIEEGFDKNFGARPLKRVVSRVLESSLAKMIIASKIKENDTVILDYQNEEFSIQKENEV